MEKEEGDRAWPAEAWDGQASSEKGVSCPATLAPSLAGKGKWSHRRGRVPSSQQQRRTPLSEEGSGQTALCMSQSKTGLLATIC